MVSRVGDELLEVAGGKILSRNQDQRHLEDQRYRGKVRRGVVEGLRIDGLVDGVRSGRAEKDFIAIRRGLGDAGGTNHAAGAADVLDDDLLDRKSVV